MGVSVCHQCHHIVVVCAGRPASSTTVAWDRDPSTSYLTPARRWLERGAGRDGSPGLGWVWVAGLGRGSCIKIGITLIAFAKKKSLQPTPHPGMTRGFVIQTPRGSDQKVNHNSVAYAEVKASEGRRAMANDDCCYVFLKNNSKQQRHVTSNQSIKSSWTSDISVCKSYQKSCEILFLMEVPLLIKTEPPLLEKYKKTLTEPPLLNIKQKHEQNLHYYWKYIYMEQNLHYYWKYIYIYIYDMYVCIYIYIYTYIYIYIHLYTLLVWSTFHKSLIFNIFWLKMIVFSYTSINNHSFVIVFLIKNHWF